MSRPVKYAVFASLCAIASTIPVAPALAQAARDVRWWEDAKGPAYGLLVYSFADSDGDGMGDLRGIEEGLDHLNDGMPGYGDDLGVSAVCLSPIHPASSYDGHDVIDFMAVDPGLGTMEDFDALVAAAHDRGVKVLLDMAFERASPERSWSRLAPGDPGIVAEIGGILAFWLGRGVDGFRFLAADRVFVPERVGADPGPAAPGMASWRSIVQGARSINPDVFAIGELRTDDAREIPPWEGVFDSLCDFPTARLVIGFPGNPGSFAASYAAISSLYAGVPGFTPATLLSDHGRDRVMSVMLAQGGVNASRGWNAVDGDSIASAVGKVLAKKKAAMAATLCQTLPGLPFVYYGEELGMTGRRFKDDDVARRDVFPWTGDPGAAPNASWTRDTGKLEPDQNEDTPPRSSQATDRASVLRHYRNLSELRASCPALRTGSFGQIPWAGFARPGIVAYLRTAERQVALVVHNASSSPFYVSAPAGSRFRLLWDSNRGLQAAAEDRLFARNLPETLDPWESAVIEVTVK